MTRLLSLFSLLILVSSQFALADYSTLTYKDSVAFMQELAAKYSQNVKLFILGDSDSGQKIVGMRIGNGSVKNLVVSTHHGNEYGATEVAKGFAASIAENPIAGQTVFVIPVLNIGGYNVKNRREPFGSQGLDQDPNRDYPGPCGTEGPWKLKSTKALADFVAAEGIVASATLHTFYPAVVYPWGISAHGSDHSTPYDDLFKTLVSAATQESGYQTGNNTEIIYPADGTFEDYAFWRHGMWSLLFELGESHTPSDEEVNHMVAVNTPGLRRFLEQSPTTRAEKHLFTGKCDTSRAEKRRDRHNE